MPEYVTYSKERLYTMEPLVRCYVCRHYDEDTGICWRRGAFGELMERGDFCSKGERADG